MLLCTSSHCSLILAFSALMELMDLLFHTGYVLYLIKHVMEFSELFSG